MLNERKVKIRVKDLGYAQCIYDVHGTRRMDMYDVV